jgi:oligopeptide transport system substrate-binding protein
MIPLNWIIVRNLLAPGIEGIVDNAKNVHPTRWVSKAE